MCSNEDIQPTDLTSRELDESKIEEEIKIEEISNFIKNDPELKASFANPALQNFAASTAAKVATSVLAGQSISSVKQSVINDVRSMAGEEMKNLAKQAGEKIGSMAAGATKGTFNVGKSSVPGSGSSGPPKGGQRGGLGGQVPFNFGLLNMNPVPVKFNLTTPIVPNCYPDYFLESNPREETRLHIVGLNVNPFATPNTQYMDRFLSMLLTKVQVYAQNSVKFRISLNTFSANQIKNYLSDLSDALILFYYLTSVLEYCKPEYKHTNEGMFALRDSLSPTDLELIYELNRYLELFPIPPRLNEYCWYMMQNYKASENPGSSIMKFCPISFGTSGFGGFTASAVAFDTGTMDNILAKLLSTDNKRVAEVFAVACPNWLKTNVVGSTGATLYSPNFSTIFGNSPFIEGELIRPLAGTVDSTFRYAVWGGRLDGLAYAMATSWDQPNSEWLPSLCSPVISFVNNDIPVNRYYYNGTNKDFEASRTDRIIVLNSGLYVHASFNDVQAISSAPGSSEYRRGVTPRNVSDSAAQVLEWLLSFDTMGSAMSDLPSNKMNRGRNRSRTQTDLGE